MIFESSYSLISFKFLAFADLFGEEFADFLDPSFNTSKYDELEMRHEQQSIRKPGGKASGIVNRRGPATSRLQIQALHGVSTISMVSTTPNSLDGESRRLQTMRGGVETTTKMNRLERIGMAGKIFWLKAALIIILTP